MRLLIVIAGLLIGGTAWASQESEPVQQYFPQQITAKKLLVYCASSAMTKVGRERRQYCAGFVSGVEESVRLLDEDLPQSVPRICVPEGVSARKIAEGYIDYANVRQRSMDQPAAAVVIEALRDRYPCSNQ